MKNTVHTGAFFSALKEHIAPTKQSKSVVHWIEDQILLLLNCSCSTQQLFSAHLLTTVAEKGNVFFLHKFAPGATCHGSINGTGSHQYDHCFAQVHLS
jgi:hypothetical protein